jgi:hypothetical protein
VAQNAVLSLPWPDWIRSSSISRLNTSPRKDTLRKASIAGVSEALGDGRAVLRRDVVIEGEVIESTTIGSPAPLGVVQQREADVDLDALVKGRRPTT